MMTWINQCCEFYFSKSASSKKLQFSVTPASPPHNFRPWVKEFPSGNVLTNFSRVAFLQSLCQLQNFQSKVDLI